MVLYAVRREFSDVEEFALNLPGIFPEVGLIIQDNRNVIKKIVTARGIFVVKDFKGMYFLNRLVYSLFRKSKAERSFLYSGILNSRGIATPPHVAWIDLYTWGLLTKSYFISVYHPEETLQQILKRGIDDKSYRSLYRQLAGFAVQLHSRGIYHRDFSIGNILVTQSEDKLQFALVDLNRIKFRNVGYKKGLRNFITLQIPSDHINMLIREYTIQSNQSPDESIALFWKIKKRSVVFRRIRKGIRHYTLTSLESVSDAIISYCRESLASVRKWTINAPGKNRPF